MIPPIRGFIESSLIEWPGRVASVLCLQGCNLACPFCHSGQLVSHQPPVESVPLEGVLAFLEDRRGWVDGVVVSGGEPTIHPGLPEMLQRLKAAGVGVKLDTNGTAPEMLSRLLDARLVDFVAMDLKAPLSAARYAAAAGGEVDVEAVRASAALLLAGRAGYEFRTTVCPAFVSLEDLEAMAESVAGARRYVLQQFVPATAMSPALHSVRPYPRQELIAAAAAMRAHVAECFLRGEAGADVHAPAAAGRRG